VAVILALGRLRQKDGKLEASLGYMARPCLTKAKGAGDREQLYFEMIWNV
jgi:hypothetical protein